MCTESKCKRGQMCTESKCKRGGFTKKSIPDSQQTAQRKKM